MTPLAHAIVADSTLPLKARRYGDAAKTLRLLDGVHFFDVSAVMDAAWDLSQRIDADTLLAGRRFAFLPAPRTWLEVRSPSGSRLAWLLEEDGDTAAVTVVAMSATGEAVETDRALWLPLSASSALGTFSVNPTGWLDMSASNKAAAVLYALLAMINTPRVIGRRQHLPHAGLQRKLSAAHRMPGKYPLQAWHELVLQVSPPVVDVSEPRAAMLTGDKARHFVRTHLRIRLGQPELVSCHWRGNDQLGIKQTRYRVVPPKAA